MISIIIPVYKVELYLNQCLESIQQQSYSKWECILINDGSPDGSGQICEQWVNKDSRFICIHQKNQGVSAARNRGLKQAKGEFIVFVDSDDWVGKDYLKHLRDSINDEHIDYVTSGLLFNEDKIITPSCMKPVISMCRTDADAFLNNLTHFYGPCSKIFRKSIIEEYNLSFPENLSLGEDMCFNFSYLNVCDKIRFLNYVDYHYRYQETGLTNKPRKNLFDILFYIWTFAVTLIKSKEMWTDEMEACFAEKLWGYTYDSIFMKPQKTYIDIKNILTKIDVSLLSEYQKNFSCTQWIKYCIIHKYVLPLYLITHFKK